MLPSKATNIGSMPSDIIADAVVYMLVTRLHNQTSHINTRSYWVLGEASRLGDVTAPCVVPSCRTPLSI